MAVVREQHQPVTDRKVTRNKTARDPGRHFVHLAIAE